MGTSHHVLSRPDYGSVKAGEVSAVGTEQCDARVKYRWGTTSTNARQRSSHRPRWPGVHRRSLAAAVDWDSEIALLLGATRTTSPARLPKIADWLVDRLIEVAPIVAITIAWSVIGWVWSATGGAMLGGILGVGAAVLILLALHRTHAD